MFLFIATIFIAELIIATTIILLIVRADKAVVKYTDLVMKKNTDLEKILKDFSFCVKSFGEYYDCMINSIKRKHRQFQINVLKNVAMYLSLFLLKGKYKKAAAFLQFAILFHDYLQKVRSN